jgi:cytochrome P450
MLMILNDMTQGVMTQLFRSESRFDPYPLYEHVRRNEPVRFDGTHGVAFGSFEACSTLLREKRISSDRSIVLAHAPGPGHGNHPSEIQSLFFTDPPEHTRLRQLIQPALTARTVARLDGFVRRTVDDLLDGLGHTNRFDVVSDIAYPLPLSVICRLIGVPPADMDRLHHLSTILPRAFDPTLAIFGTPPPEQAERQAAEAELNEYFVDLARRRRRDPGDDLVSELAQMSVAADRLSEAELADTCRLLLNGGHHTTVILFTNALRALLERPTLVARLLTEPWLVDAVIEETLRYEPPLQIFQRFVPTDQCFQGTQLSAGDTLMLFVAAAQRDPAAFGDPNSFRPDREDCRHLSFGAGIHYCLGAPLARMEVRHALVRFLQRIPDPTVDWTGVAYEGRVALRGMSRFPIDFSVVRGRDLPWLT